MSDKDTFRANNVEVNSFASRDAPHSSSLEIDNFLSGATLVFAVTNVNVGGPSSYVARM